jgi:putative flippase GtrA
MGIGTTSKRWLTFNGVGVLGAALQLAVLAFLTRQLGLAAAWATPLAVEAAILHNFFWHQRVTWPLIAKEQGMAARLFRFHALNGLVSLAGNAMITITLSAAGLDVLIANLAAILVCSMLNFVLGDRVVFRRSLSAPLCLGALMLTAQASVSGFTPEPAATGSPEPLTISGPSAAAIAAWNNYVAKIEERYAAPTQSNFFALDGRRVQNWRDRAVKGTVPMVATDPADAPDAKIHHWTGAIYIPKTTVAAVVKRMQEYAGREMEFYQEVKASKLLDRNGERLNVFMRLQRDAGVVNAEYNTEHAVEYRSLDANRATSRSTSTKIAELEGAGTASERELPPGQDRGFLWKLNAYWRFEQSGDGVFIECESVSLSRGVPWLVRPIASPIVNRIARESLERTLRSLRAFLTVGNIERARGTQAKRPAGE